MLCYTKKCNLCYAIYQLIISKYTNSHNKHQLAIIFNNQPQVMEEAMKSADLVISLCPDCVTPGILVSRRPCDHNTFSNF